MNNLIKNIKITEEEEFTTKKELEDRNIRHFYYLSNVIDESCYSLGINEEDFYNNLQLFIGNENIKKINNNEIIKLNASRNKVLGEWFLIFHYEQYLDFLNKDYSNIVYK